MYNVIVIISVNSKILSQTVMKLHAVLGVQTRSDGGREDMRVSRLGTYINSSHRDSDIRLELFT